MFVRVYACVPVHSEGSAGAAPEAPTGMPLLVGHREREATRARRDSPVGPAEAKASMGRRASPE